LGTDRARWSKQGPYTEAFLMGVWGRRSSGPVRI